MPRRTPESPPDIYVHVPKTAGTTLRRAVIEHYGAKEVWIYDLSSARLLRADRQLYRPEDPKHIALRRLIAQVPSPIVQMALKARELTTSSPETAYRKASAIIGHFTINQVDEFWKDAPAFTVVRDPFTRMVSHYRYLQQSARFDPSLRSWMAGNDPSLPFEAFAMGENVRDFQTRYTGTDPDRYSHIGLAESLGSFMRYVGLVEPGAEIPRINETRGAMPDLSSLDKGFYRDFQEFHANDYAFYNSAVAKARIA